MSVVLLAVTLALATRQADLETRPYDVRGLRAALASPERRVATWSFLAGAHNDDEYVSSQAEVPHGSLDWVELLHAIAPDAGVGVFESAGLLTVEAPPAVHVDVERILAEIEAHLAREVALEAFALDPSTVSQAATAVLGAAQARDVLARARVLDHAFAVGRMAQPAHLGADATWAWVGGIRVEGDVQSTVGADPAISLPREGLDLEATVRAAPDGRLVLDVVGRRGERAHPALPTVPPIVRESARFVSLAASATIDDGGAVLLGATRHGPGLVLLRARRLLGAAGDAGRFLSAGEASAPRDTPLAPWMARPPSSFESEFPPPAFRFGRDEPTPALLDALRLPGGVFRLADSLYAPAGGASLDEVRTLLESVRGTWEGTVAFELRCGLVDPALLDVPAGVLAEELRDRVLGVARLGRTAFVQAGTEVSYVSDHDVQVASGGVTPPWPGTSTVEGGIGLACSAQRLGDGELAVDVLLDVQEVDALAIERVGFGIVRRWPVPVPTWLETNLVELPRTRCATFRALAVTADGEWSHVGAATRAGERRVFAAVVRAQRIAPEGGR